jgi:hypothetical protein
MLKTALLLLSLFLPIVATAQRLAVPRIGTRVRATPRAGPGSTITGLLTSHSGDTIAVQVQSNDTARISLSSLSQLEVSDGYHSNFGKGAGYGFIIGAAGGAAVGAAAIDPEWAGVGALLGAGTGGLLGFLIGGGIGSSTTSERWRPAPGWEVNPELSAQPSGATVGITIRF